MKRLIIVLAVLALAGCSDSNQADVAPASSPADKSATGEKSVRDRVVVTVNGRELHSTNLNERVEMFVKVSTIANPKMALSDIPKLRSRLKASVPKLFVREVVFDEYAQAEKLKVDDVAIEKARKKLMTSFKGRMTFENLRRKMGPLAEALDEFVRVQATEDVVRQRILEKNPLVLPPNYAKEQTSRAKAYNARMALTNALVFARATNVWEKLKNGADFKQMARQFSELPKEAEEGGEWGTLGIQQLEPDEDLVKWAQKLQPGEFSPPIEGDNGLMVLKMDSKKGEDCSLSRIYFKLPMFQDVVSEEELVKMKRQRHEMAVLNREIKALVKAAKVVKPKAKKKTSKKVKAKKKAGKKGKSKKSVNKAVDSGAKVRSDKTARKNGESKAHKADLKKTEKKTDSKKQNNKSTK